ncbi:MAG: hypothetical protein ACI4M3_08045 [Acutalibacteraceae bacterium]
MSWFNPEPQEAQESYYYNKRRFISAAEARADSRRQEKQYAYEKKEAQRTISNCKYEKTNFEKRIKGIEKIIKMLEDTGGFFSVSVPTTISKAVKQSSQADASFKGCIKASDTVAANLDGVISVKTVEGETHSCSALEKLKSEKARLEESVQELNNRITNLTTQIDTLTSQIRACDAEQASYQRIMAQSSYEMSHYRRYM